MAGVCLLENCTYWFDCCDTQNRGDLEAFKRFCPLESPKEYYLVMYPDNSMRWIQIDRCHLLDELYKAIGCDCVENVRTIIPDVCLIVDESGKIKDPPQCHNELASILYAGWIIGADDIVGPAVVAAIHLVDGESDWVPLNAAELNKLRALGYPIPDPPTLPE